VDTTDKRSVWHTIEGVGLIVLGLAAILLPVFAGAAFGLTLGIVLVAAGVVGLISTFQGRRHQHQGWSLASSLIALIAGLLIVFMPVLGADVVALILAFYLLLDGVAQIGLALDHRKRGDGAAGWLIAVGVLDLVLALVIVVLSPAGKAALIGFIIGVDLILAGAAMLALHRPFPMIGRPPTA
jgi:uncharacterized membrane protein HdeD (DUF308 family)